MSFPQQILSTNVEIAKSVAYIEAGHVINNRLAALIKPKLPFFVSGYADQPIGKFVIANALLAAAQTLPSLKGNTAVQRLAQAAVADAQQQFLRSIDVDGIVAQLLGDPTIAAAVAQTA